MKNNKSVRLTEAQLHNVIKESVKRVLRENPENEGWWGRTKGAAQGISNAVRGEYDKVKRGVSQTGLDNEYQGQSLGKRFNAAKNMVKAGARMGDLYQECQKINDFLLKNITYSNYPQIHDNEKIQNLCNELDAAIRSTYASNEVGNINAQYSKYYGK